MDEPVHKFRVPHPALLVPDLMRGVPAWAVDHRCGGGLNYPIQPSSFMAQPAFQIFVMWLILPSSNSIA